MKDIDYGLTETLKIKVILVILILHLGKDIYKILNYIVLSVTLKFGVS